MPKLKLVDGGPVTARRYPPEPRFNPGVPPAEWPFAETAKGPDDVVISLAVTPRPVLVARKRGWLA